MNIEWYNILVPLITALLGGVTSIWLFPEKKQAAKLDNAERVIKRYEDLIDELKKQYERRIEDLERQVKTLESKNHMLEQQVLKLQNTAVTRGSNGRFTKKEKD